jgi:riboflavin synthase
MFTGIVTAVGRISEMSQGEGSLRLAIAPLAGHIALESACSGDSVAVAGVCLTMLDPGDAGFEADVSAETLAATTMGDRQVGDRVNLELAVRAGDRLGGHLVSGHVDAAVTVTSRRPIDDSERFEFELPERHARLVSRKGSVCIDGVSLTVNDVTSERFSVCIIPHTLAATTLGELYEGDRANLEVDMIARYLERLIEGRSP